MNDQRIELGPLLGLVDSGHGVILPRVGAQPVDRFGGEGDKTALRQDLRGAGQVLGAGAET